jgi:hypothetical protein
MMGRPRVRKMENGESEATIAEDLVFRCRAPWSYQRQTIRLKCICPGSIRNATGAGQHRHPLSGAIERKRDKGSRARCEHADMHQSGRELLHAGPVQVGDNGPVLNSDYQYE